DSPPAALHLCAILTLADIDVAEYLIDRLLIDHRSDVGLITEAIAEPQVFRAFYQRTGEFLCDFLVDDDTRGGGAPLSRGSECAPQYPFNREVQVGVVHNHHDVLAAHLKRTDLVVSRGRLTDNPADVGRA